MKKWILPILIFSVVLVLLSGLITISGQKESPTMFCNDDPWFDEYRLGFEKIFSQYYLPLSMFEKIEGVEIRANSRLGTLLLSRGGDYISFDLDSNFAYTEQEGNFFLRTYLLKGGERYLPGEEVCRALKLTFEVSSDGSAVRIRDDKAQKTMEQLLAQYSTEPTPVDPGNENPFLPPADDGEKKTVYLLFDSVPNPSTGKVLAVLNEYGVKATFFVETEAVKDDLSCLASILAGGHRLALSTSDGTVKSEKTELLDDLMKANELLFSLFKTKVQVFHLPYGPNGMTRLSEETEAALREKGYFVCQSNIDAWEEMNYYSSEQIASRILSDLMEAETPCIRFSGGDQTSEILRMVLSYLVGQKDRFSFRAVDSLYPGFH